MSTLKEVAALSGYAVSTVSAVLGGKSVQRGISESTQIKILEAASQLNYQTNISARALRDHDNQGMFLIAIFWSKDFRAPMMLRFFNGLQENLASRTDKQNIKFVINFYENDKLCEEPGLQSRSYYHAAIICNASKKDMEFLETVNLPVPTVLYNRPSQLHNSVLVQDVQFGEIAAHVFASHRKKTAQIVTSPDAFVGMGIRRSAFEQTAANANIEVFPPLFCNNSMAGGYEAAQILLAQKRLPECLFCGSDAIALGIFRAFHEKKISIPEEIEIIAVGNGDKDQERFAIPSLSVVALPMEEMASRCLDRLLELNANPFAPPHQEFLELEYISRESCGPLL